MPSATRNKVYISIGEWQYKQKYSIPYTGYVIGVGYAYVEYKSIAEVFNPDQSRLAYPSFGSSWLNQLNGTDSNLFDFRVITEQHIDPSEDAIKESFPPIGNIEDNKPYINSSLRTFGWSIGNASKAMDIGPSVYGSNNISSTVVRFQTREGKAGAPILSDGDAYEQNAFRHVLWQSYITNKHGYEVALGVGNSHENNPNVDTTQRRVRTREEADMLVDLLNNKIGRTLGRNHQTGILMNAMALSVLDQFYENGLYTAQQVEDGTYYIDRTTITQSQYEELKAIFQTLNFLGRTDKEQMERDEVDRERLERMQATWGTMK